MDVAVHKSYAVWPMSPRHTSNSISYFRLLTLVSVCVRSVYGQYSLAIAN